MKPKTAAERLAELNLDPNYQAMLAQKAQRRDATRAFYAADEKPLVDALHAIGLRVRSVWDLVNSAKSYPKAVPVLLEHLLKPYQFRTREGIARALAVKEARGVGAAVVLGGT